MTVEPAAWRIRPYRPGDESALVAMFHDVFRRPIDEAYWRWKLKALPAPAENVGVAVNEDDRPVFQIGGMPGTWWIDHREALVMVAVDAMTHPHFRRRGILTEVSRQLFQTWRDAGVSLVLGLPNEQWGSRVAALGWRKLFSLQWLVRLLRPGRMVARRWPRLAGQHLDWLDRSWKAAFRVRAANGEIDVSTITNVPGGVDALVTRGRGHMPIHPYRGAARLQWRYVNAPHRRYRVALASRRGEPCGYAVHFERDSRQVHWVIAEVATLPYDRSVREALIGYIVRNAEEIGAEAVSVLAAPRSQMFNSCVAAGFLPTPRSFSVHCVPLDMSVNMALLKDPRAWDLAGGDFDVV